MSAYAAQAQQDVRQAYRPAFKALNRQARRVKAMAHKQQRDDQAYQNWLRDTNASLNAEAAQRDQQLQGVEAGYNAQVQQAFSAAQSQSATRNAQTGGTGGPAAWGVQGTASEHYDPNIQAIQNFGQAQSAAYGLRNAERQGLGLALSHSVEKNTYATVAQVRAQHRAQTFDALSKIAQQRGDLQMKRAADVGKREAELEAAAAKQAQQQFTNELALQRLAQGDQRIALAQQVAADRSTLSHESARQGRVRNQLARRRLAAGNAPGTRISPAEQRARATRVARAQAAVDRAVAMIRSDSSALKHYGSGAQWQNLVRHLVSRGVPYPVAVVAAAKFHGKGTARVPDAWKQAINIQSA